MKLRNLLALGALAAGAAYLYRKAHANTDESEIIGGADGPTTIHVHDTAPAGDAAAPQGEETADEPADCGKEAE